MSNITRSQYAMRVFSYAPPTIKRITEALEAAFVAGGGTPGCGRNLVATEAGGYPSSPEQRRQMVLSGLCVTRPDLVELAQALIARGTHCTGEQWYDDKDPRPCAGAAVKALFLKNPVPKEMEEALIARGTHCDAATWASGDESLPSAAAAVKGMLGMCLNDPMVKEMEEALIAQGTHCDAATWDSGEHSKPSTAAVVKAMCLNDPGMKLQAEAFLAAGTHCTAAQKVAGDPRPCATAAVKGKKGANAQLNARPTADGGKPVGGGDYANKLAQTGGRGGKKGGKIKSNTRNVLPRAIVTVTRPGGSTLTLDATVGGDGDGEFYLIQSRGTSNIDGLKELFAASKTDKKYDARLSNFSISTVGLRAYMDRKMNYCKGTMVAALLDQKYTFQLGELTK
jgi:hypothetical protein